MVLEATLICLDNSEYSRNGDYVPSRLEAQCDAANLICGAKTNQNPENSVGLLTSGGDRIIVRVAPTQDLGKILQGLHNIPSEGEADIIRAVQTAQLALKHRMNKNQRQRIVLFVGSPVSASEKQLEQLGRVLKKNNVSIDIISFGETEANSAKLHKFHSTVNSNDTSHLIEYPVNTSRMLSDLLRYSPVIRGGDTADSGGAAADLGNDDGATNEIGVDAATDPELYMALQISIQEERARLARVAAVDAQAVQNNDPTVVNADNNNITVHGDISLPTSQTESHPTANDIDAMEGIDDELRQALLISLNDFHNISTESQDTEMTDININNYLSGNESYEIAASGNVGIIPAENSTNPTGSLSNVSATAEEVAASTNLPNESTATSSLSAPNTQQSFVPPTSSSALIQQLLEMPGVDMTDPRLLEALQHVADIEVSPSQGTNSEENPEDSAADSKNDKKD